MTPEDTYRTIEQRMFNIHKHVIRDGGDPDDVAGAMLTVIVRAAFQSGSSLEEMLDFVRDIFAQGAQHGATVQAPANNG